jgi:hypothetical protein
MIEIIFHITFEIAAAPITFWSGRNFLALNWLNKWTIKAPMRIQTHFVINWSIKLDERFITPKKDKNFNFYCIYYL